MNIGLDHLGIANNGLSDSEFLSEIESPEL